MFKRLFNIFILSFLTMLIVAALCACGNGGGNGKEDTAGGQSSSPEPVLYWKGLNDFALPYTLNNYEYSDVTVKNAEGLSYHVTVDDSQVKYGEMGEYVVSFSVGNNTKTAAVKIYNAPTLNVPGSLILSYEQALDSHAEGSLYKQAQAVDCFGGSIAVGVVENENNSLYGSDGSANYGTFDVALAAMDASGQIVQKQVSITVEESPLVSPQFLDDQLTADVIDSQSFLTVDLNDQKIAILSLNGKAISPAAYHYDRPSSQITLEISQIEEVALGSNKLRLVTTKGYDEVILSLEDKKPIQIDNYGNWNYAFEVGSSVQIKYPKALNPKQNFTFTYQLLSPSGIELPLAGQGFTATKKGIYKLVCTAVRDAEVSSVIEIKYHSYSQEEFLKIYDAAFSLDCFENNKFISSGINFEYSEEVGIGPSYKLWTDIDVSNPLDNAYLRFGELATMREDGNYAGVAFDIYCAEELTKLLFAVENLYWNGLYDGKTAIDTDIKDLVYLIDSSTGYRVEKVAAGVWHRLVINWNELGVGEVETWRDLRHGITDGNRPLYIRNVSFLDADELAAIKDIGFAPMFIGEDEFNSIASDQHLLDAKAYSNVFKNASEIPVTFFEGEIGGESGTYAQVYVGYGQSYLGINIPCLKTKQELIDMKDDGKTVIKTRVLVTANGIKALYTDICSVNSVPSNHGNIKLSQNIWTDYEISIDKIIENYDALLLNEKVLITIYNGGDGVDVHEDNFYIYIGALTIE